MKLKKSLILICVLSLVLSGIPANKAKAFTSSDIIVENGDLLLDGDKEFHTMDFGLDETEYICPVTFENTGALLIEFSGALFSEEDYQALSINLYTDKDCTDNVYDDPGVCESVAIIGKVFKISKAGTYYLKFKLARLSVPARAVSYDYRILTLSGGTRQLTENMTYAAYQGIDSEDILYKFTASKKGKYSFRYFVDNQALIFGRFTLLDSDKKTLIKEEYEAGPTEGLKKSFTLDKGTYYLKIKADHGLYNIGYTYSPVSDKAGHSLKKAKKLTADGKYIEGMCTPTEAVSLVDYYKFSVTNEDVTNQRKSADVAVGFSYDVSETLIVELCNSKGSVIELFELKATRVTDGYLYGNTQGLLSLKKGTYYFKVYRPTKTCSGYYKIAIKK